MSTPKHLHWVPYFYLRYFATPESRDGKRPQVWIFSKEDADGDEVLTNVRNVCGKRYLYSPLDASGKRNLHLEEKLSHLESVIGRLWPGIADGFIDLSDDAIRKGLSLFVAVMHLRNPEFRRSVEQIHTQLIESYADLPVKADGTPNIDYINIEGQARPFDSSGWNEYQNWAKNDHDLFFIQFIQSEAIRAAETLMKKRWSIVFSQHDSFITTDKPVLLAHPSRQACGYGTPGAVLTFPLGPKRLLVMDDMHHEQANQYYKQADAGAYNFAAWHKGSRFLITGRPIRDVLSEMTAWTESQNG
jgi:hypothetical protein